MVHHMRSLANRIAFVSVFLCLVWPLRSQADFAQLPAGQSYPFGVLNQRSVTLTAEYWNPILGYVSSKTGIPLTLRIARTANETTDLAVNGELAFVFTNHLFTPKRDKLGFTVLARQEGPPIHSQIIVDNQSPATRLDDLREKSIAFANPYAFVGYFVPFDALLKKGIQVNPVFAGNQEAAIGRLHSGQVAAAGVNDKVLINYARREHYTYRVLWTSEPYYDLAVMAHPSVPKEIRERVAAALIGMATDPAGLSVLKHSAALLDLNGPRGFAPASDRDYTNYRDFFRQTRVPLEGQ